MSKIDTSVSTKDRIAREALHLFSAQGYAATSVRDIASAVGIKDSSLYNHYKSKQEIFNYVIEVYFKSGEKKFFSFYQKNYIPEDSLALFSQPQVITAMAKELFTSFIADDDSNKLRQMLITEMYHNELAAKAYAKYLKEPLDWTTLLFEQMIAMGLLEQADAQILAYTYMTPVYTLITEHECGEISTEFALDFLERHITLFFQNHKRTVK